MTQIQPLKVSLYSYLCQLVLICTLQNTIRTYFIHNTYSYLFINFIVCSWNIHSVVWVCVNPCKDMYTHVYQSFIENICLWICFLSSSVLIQISKSKPVNMSGFLLVALRLFHSCNIKKIWDCTGEIWDGRVA